MVSAKILIGALIVFMFAIVIMKYPNRLREVIVIGIAVFLIYLVIAFVVTKTQGEESGYYW